MNQQKIYLIILTILLSGLFCFYSASFFTDKELYLSSLSVIPFLGIYYFLRCKYNKKFNLCDVILVIILLGVIILLEKGTLFSIRTTLRIEEVAFLLLSIFLIIKIKKVILRKYILFSLVVVSITDFIAIKIQATHLNYAFLANIDFSIIPILFSVFLYYTIGIFILLLCSIILLKKYEYNFYLFTSKAFDRMYIPALVFMTIAFMPNGVLHSAYFLVRDVVCVNFTNNNDVAEILHQMNIDSKQFKKKMKLLLHQVKM